MYSNKVTFISVALYTIQTNSKCVWVCAAVFVWVFGKITVCAHLWQQHHWLVY